VFGFQPPFGVAAAEPDQLVDELLREEQVAEQLPVDGAALGVDEPAQQRDARVVEQAVHARVVTVVDGAREASDLQAIFRRDEDVGDLPPAAGAAVAALLGERFVDRRQRGDVFGELV
jgi:hypothetical protein